MEPFESLSYLAQVRRFRRLAEVAVRLFPIKNASLKFINYGENTTYKVSTKNQHYLLRIHRKGYHSQAAIMEELKWMLKIGGNSDLPVQKPVKSKYGRYVEMVHLIECGGEYAVDLLQWCDGDIRGKQLSPSQFFLIGQVAGELRQKKLQTSYKHRMYWDLPGLIGRNATLGPISELGKRAPLEFEILMGLSEQLEAQAKSYVHKKPHRFGLIHADLHFGNIVWQKGMPVPIDFDDCGYGFHMYELAVTLYSSAGIFRRCNKQKRNEMIESLFLGYSTLAELTQDDINILPTLIDIRLIAMLGWLHRRRDNPLLRKHFHTYLETHFSRFKNVLKHGSTPLFN